MAEKKATRAAYGEALCELGAADERVVVLDADLAHATMTSVFKERFSGRFYDIGIAECNLAGISAGLAGMGLVPFISTFAMFAAGRGYEVIRNSIAYPRLNVKIAATHAGITVGEDGASHQAIEDIALMRAIPGMTVISPADAVETKKAIFAAAQYDGPVYIRLGRSPVPVLEGGREAPFVLGRANVLREGGRAAVFATGYMVHIALEAADALARRGAEISVINVHTIKPLDAETVLRYADKTKNVITLEEHSVIGGLGDAVAGALIGRGNFRFTGIGVEDRFGQSGSATALLDEYGLSTEKVLARIEAAL
jgi:transketolase